MTTGQDARADDVRRALATVDDPELDEPVTGLGFVERVTVEDDDVTVGFRLPTYWCAANFAFLMADDMRRAVEALPWVRRVNVILGEHMYADTINNGLSQGLTFQQTFGADAAASLDELRRTFLVKSFQRRQEALLNHLLQTGHTPEDLTELTVAELRAMVLDSAGAAARTRYLERRGICAIDSNPHAFIDHHGLPLTAETLPAYLRSLGRVSINAEFNGALCRGLLAARYNMAMPDGEPTLLDFARMPPTQSRASAI